MQRIEFIGASGVGKSSLFEQLAKQRSGDDDWLTPEEARIKIAKKVENNAFIYRKQAFILFLIRNGFYKGRHAFYADRILRNFKKEALRKCGYKFACLAEMHFLGLYQNEHMSSLRKLNLARCFLDRLVNDILILDLFNINDVIVYHDGIVHLNSGIYDAESYREQISADRQAYRNINPAGIIHCILSGEENFKRRLKRIDSDRATFVEKEVGYNELRAETERELTAAARKAHVMRSVGVPVIDIDMSIEQGQSIPRILEFIRCVTARPHLSKFGLGPGAVKGELPRMTLPPRHRRRSAVAPRPEQLATQQRWQRGEE